MAFFLRMLLYDRHATPSFFHRRCDLSGARLCLFREIFQGKDFRKTGLGKASGGRDAGAETHSGSI